MKFYTTTKALTRTDNHPRLSLFCTSKLVSAVTAQNSVFAQQIMKKIISALEENQGK